MPTPSLRFQLWVNRHQIHDGLMTLEEAQRATRTAESMLKPRDTFVIIAEGLGSPENPWVLGNDSGFADELVRSRYPGLKLPEGETRWQQLHGVRPAPAPPTGWDGIA